MEHRKQEEENEEEDENENLPLFQPSVARKKDFIQHPYNLRPREWKIATTNVILMSTHL